MARSIREARSAVEPIATIRTIVGYTGERFRYFNEIKLYISNADLIKILFQQVGRLNGEKCHIRIQCKSHSH